MIPDLATTFANLPPELPEDEEEACGAVDDVTGATCTRPPHAHLDLRHTDQSTWDLIVHWNEPVTIAL